MNLEMIKKMLFLGWLCCVLQGTVWAQDATMADFRAVVAQMKALKTYSYETTTNAVFPNGKKDRMVTTVYMDGPGKRLCYKTNVQVLLLTNQWAYKADHRSKNVSVFNVVKYNDRYKKALPELDAVFKSSLAATFMDSVVLRSGKLVSAKKKGDMTTYTLHFPRDFGIEEIVIAYDNARKLPESVRIKTFQAGDLEGTRERGMHMETISRGYTTNVPEAVFNVQQYFKIQGGKVVLTQFKNYKVSSIL